MKKSKVPSPTRSTGESSSRNKISIRRHSVDSPGPNNSTHFSAETRQSLLTDNTDIEQPVHKSWWKRLEDSHNIIPMDHPVEENDSSLSLSSVSLRGSKVFDLIGLEVLSQGSRKYTVLESDTSEGELHSIVIPPRKLFQQQISAPQEKFKEIKNNKDILLSPQQTSESNINLDIQVQPKKLFEQAPKPRSKPVFPTELLSITANKTAEIPELKSKRQVGTLFGNKGATKRKNVFADCFSSDSNDELPEIQARIFDFNKQPNNNWIARKSTNTRTSTSFNVNDWKELASSTMLENLTEKTSLDSRRLSQLNDGNCSTNNSPKSRISRNRSKSIQETCLNQHNSSKKLDKSSDRTLTNESISEKAPSLNQHSHIKNMDGDNTLIDDITTNIEHQIDNNMSVESIEIDKEKPNFISKNISINNPYNKEVATDCNDKKQQEHNSSNKEKIIVIENKMTDITESYENSKIMDRKDNEHDFTCNIASEVQDKSQVGKHIMNDCNQENDMTNGPRAIETKEQTIAEKINASYFEKQVAIETKIANEIKQDDSKTEIVSEIIQDDSETDEIASKKVANVTRDQDACETEEVTTKGEEKNASETEEVATEAEEQDFNETEEVASEAEEQNSSETEEVASEAEEQNSSKTEEKIVGNTTIGTETINATETEHDNDNLVEQYEIENESVNKENENRVESDGSRKQMNKEAMSPPEVVLHNKTKLMADSIVVRRNTSISKTLYNTLRPRPSSIPLRESTGFSDRTNDSSANRSGWDSHRTTRKTLRQTFGKDFTPRKSLRTLVMEKSAKRQTQFTQEPGQAEVMDTADDIQTNIEERENLANSIIVAEEQANCERIDDTHEDLGILDETPSNLRSKYETLENLDTDKTYSNFKGKDKTLENSRTLNKTHENSKSKNITLENSNSKNIILENSRTLDKIHENSKSKNITLENSKTINDTHENLKSKYIPPEISQTLDKTNKNLSSKNETLENLRTLDKTHEKSMSNKTQESFRNLDQTPKNSSIRKNLQENMLKFKDLSKSQANLSEATNSTAHFVTIDETYENSVTMDQTCGNTRLTKSINVSGKETKSSKLYETTNYETIDETHENSRTMDKNNANLRYENQTQANYSAIDSQTGSKFFNNTRTYNETANNTEFTMAHETPLAYSTSYNHHSITYNTGVDEIEENLKIIFEYDEAVENSENIDENDEINEIFENIDDVDENVDQDDESHDNSENIDENDETNENFENMDDVDENVDQDDESHDNSETINEDSDRISEDNGIQDDSEIMDNMQSNSEIEIHANNEVINAENTIVNKVPLANSTQYANIHSDEPSVDQDESIEESLDEAAFEMALKKIREDKIATKRKLDEDIQNSIKRSKFSFFKVPQAPVRLRPVKPVVLNKPKPKPKIPVGYDLLPREILNDLNYKPPKKYKPPNASWVTKHLYKFLEDKLRPKYDYKARVRAEKFVETLYNFTKDIRRHHPAAPKHLVHALKQEMARLNIVTTHYDFYDFFFNFMPREIRTKVIPDIVNGIPLPKEGGFSNII